MAPRRKPPTKRRKKTSSDHGKAEKEEKRKAEEPKAETKEDKLLAQMKVIMDSVQRGHTHVVTNIDKMWQLKNKYSDENLCFEHFWYLLQHACLVSAREPPTERIIQFCCKFAVKADLDGSTFTDDDVSQTGPFARCLFFHALKYHDANDKAVRFRLCQITNLLLTSLGGNAEIDEDLYNKIFKCMLERIRDKVPGVRIQAVNTLNRLQDPSDQECPVMKGYLNIMKTDGVAEVRRAAVKAIGLNSKSLVPIIDRVRDTNPGVRRAAFEVLTDKISIRGMKIAYRMKLLDTGLKDRNAAVRDACTQLIKKWLAYYDHDVIKLLKALDVEGKAELCGDVVTEILKQMHVESATECLFIIMVGKVIPTDNLTCENVFFWRCLISYCIKQAPDMYDRLMPSLTDLSVYLKEYIVLASNIPAEDFDAHYQASYVITELIKIAKLADFSDEAGRKALIVTNKYIITEAEITVQALEKLVELYCLAEPDEQTKINTIAEIINDVRNPLEGGTQLDLHAIESCEKNDPVTMIRCLTMVSGLLQCVMSDAAFNPTLSSLLDDVVMTGVIADNEIVRHLAIKALGISCILSKTLAKKYLMFFLQVIMVDNYAEILETTLKIIIDIFLVFGIEMFAEDDKEDDKATTEEDTLTNMLMSSKLEATTVSEEATSVSGEADITAKEQEKEAQGFVNVIIEKFKEFLDDEVLRGVAAEGIAKLMYNRRLVDAQLFSRLVILWYNPISEEDPLRHCLGIFFSTYGANNRESLDVIEQAFFPTIQTICDAPHISPLHQINPQNVAELMLSLLRGDRNEQIAIKLCNEILINPRSTYGRCLIKTLHHCNIVGLEADQANLKLVHSLVEQIVEEVEHTSTKRALASYLARLEAFIVRPEPGENKEKENKENCSLLSVSTQELEKQAKKKILFVPPSQPVDFLDTIT